MKTMYEIPAGYIEIFPKDNIPKGWTPLDGAGGTPDIRSEPLKFNMGRTCITLSNKEYIPCMYKYEDFKSQNPSWVKILSNHFKGGDAL